MNCWISLRNLPSWMISRGWGCKKRDPGCPTWFLHVCNLAQIYPRELQTSIGSSNFLLFECWQTHALLDMHLFTEVKALHLQHIKGFDFESTTLGTMIEVRFSFLCAICCGIERRRRGFWKMLIWHRIGHKSNTQVQTMWYLHNYWRISRYLVELDFKVLYSRSGKLEANIMFAYLEPPQSLI